MFYWQLKDVKDEVIVFWSFHLLGWFPSGWWKHPGDGPVFSHGGKLPQAKTEICPHADPITICKQLHSSSWTEAIIVSLCFPEISWKNLKLSLLSPCRRFSCAGKQTWFNSPLNYVLKINEFNYLLNVSMVSGSATNCAYQWAKPESKTRVCLFAKNQIKLYFRTNLSCQVINVQKRMGTLSNSFKQDAIEITGFMFDSKEKRKSHTSYSWEPIFTYKW